MHTLDDYRNTQLASVDGMSNGSIVPGTIPTDTRHILVEVKE